MFGFLGMFLNRADAEAISSERHYAIMDAINQRARDIDEYNALSKEARRLEQMLERAYVGIESYRDFTREIFVTPEERAQVNYRRSRHEDRHIEERLRDGRLNHDPRKDPKWAKYYVPPRPEDMPGHGK
ncbi:hypothetical protein [Dentiradicibacter hellwigii]|uniref:Uncharacterized protein n=1 Tax=Dentiradicibacter hellwigii TaxID=3149053 RepID=A0ABV4UEV7_9RHOO